MVYIYYFQNIRIFKSIEYGVFNIIHKINKTFEFLSPVYICEAITHWKKCFFNNLINFT